MIFLSKLTPLPTSVDTPTLWPSMERVYKNKVVQVNRRCIKQ